MGEPLELVAEQVPNLISAVAFILLASWIAWLNLGSRVHQAFALYLSLAAAFSGLIALYRYPDEYFGRIHAYVAIALPFAALYFAVVAWRSRGPTGATSPARSWVMPAGLGLGALIFELLYVTDHGRYAARLGQDQFGPFFEIGPLFLFADAVYLAYAVIALVLALAYVSSERGPKGRALYVVSLGFALVPAFMGPFFLLGFGEAPDPQADLVGAASYWIYAGAFVLAVAPAVVLVVAAAIGRAENRVRDAVRYVVVLSGPVASAILMHSVAGRASPETVFLTLSSFGALWHVAAVAFAAFAILRHRFLDLDVRVRWTISRGVVASAFVATFFVVTEGLAYFLGRETENAYVGIVVTGVLVFALSPLKRFGDRVAKAAMPDALPVEERSLDERIALFAEQTRIAWEDGVLTAKERRMLDFARGRLGVSEGQAARIERRVLEELYPVRRKRRARPASTTASDRWAVRE